LCEDAKATLKRTCLKSCSGEYEDEEKEEDEEEEEES